MGGVVLLKALVLFVLGMLVLLSACTVGSRSQSPASESPREPTVSTAKGAYPLAERVARKWKLDAELRSVRSTWQNPTPAQLREGKVSWAFYFVSPSSTRGGKVSGYIVSVSGGEAEGVREGQFAATAKSLIFVDWKVDSPQALKVFLDNGGQDFLASHAQADIHAILQTAEGAESPIWEMTALDRQTKATMSLQVDASSGTARRRS